MLRSRTWQGMDRVDSLSVAVFGGLLTYAAVRAGTLLAPRLGDLRTAPGAVPDGVVLLIWLASVVLVVAGATAGVVLTAWGASRALRPLRVRRAATVADAEPAPAPAGR